MTLSNLAAAAQERKARLAQLKNLKRKQDESRSSAEQSKLAPGSTLPTSSSTDQPGHDPESQESSTSLLPGSKHDDGDNDVSRYLSGRNYDAANRAPKLGFEQAPIGEDQDTLERRAERVLAETKAVAEGIIPKSVTDATTTTTTTTAGEDPDAPSSTIPAPAGTIDLFSLRPKKPNWDLRRALEKRMEVLDVRTDNAIAKLVRERVERQRVEAKTKAKGAKSGDGAGDGAGGSGKTDNGDDGDDGGEAGEDLVEMLHLREKMAEEERRKELEEDEEGDE